MPHTPTEAYVTLQLVFSDLNLVLFITLALSQNLTYKFLLSLLSAQDAPVYASSAHSQECHTALTLPFVSASFLCCLLCMKCSLLIL